MTSTPTSWGLLKQPYKQDITSRYSLFFRGNTANSGNFGAGVNLWLWQSLGLKVEFRDHVASPGGDTAHWWGVRLGLNF